MRSRWPWATSATSPRRSGSATRVSTRDARAATSSTVSPGVSPGATPSPNTVQAGSPSDSRISRRGAALVVAVVPLHQVVVGDRVEARQLRRAPGSRQRRAQHEREVEAGQHGARAGGRHARRHRSAGRRFARCAARRGSTRSRRGGGGRDGRSARLLATCAPLWHPGARMSGMPSYVAFLRAVNVGGRFVKMAELRSELEGAGFTDVETHIQSGNVFVRSGRRSTGAVSTEMARVLGEWAGFDVPCVVRTPTQLRAALAAVDAVPPLLAGRQALRRVRRRARAGGCGRAARRVGRAGGAVPGARLGDPRRDGRRLPEDEADQHPDRTDHRPHDHLARPQGGPRHRREVGSLMAQQHEQETGGTGPGHRSIQMSRTGTGTYLVTNARGGTMSIGSGESADFTPVELLLTAIGGCSAIDVDFITSRLRRAHRVHRHRRGREAARRARQPHGRDRGDLPGALPRR